jgi:hypothetical protein
MRIMLEGEMESGESTEMERDSRGGGGVRGMVVEEEEEGE